MGLSAITYALCKKYVEQSLIGLGALKGANCQIQSITPITGGNRVTFLWKDINDDPHTSTLDVMNGEGGGGELTEDLHVTRAVGGVPVGRDYPVGTPIETIIRNMLNPVSVPTLTNPSATITGTGDKILERGSTLAATIKVNFSRGSINPAYGTSGYRSGPATGYILNGGAEQATNSFSVIVSEDNNKFKGKVNYSEGEQPKDSEGNNYNSPLPAGSVQSAELEYEFVNAWWGNTDDPDVIVKMPLISQKPGETLVTFCPVDDDQAEKFDIPASWNLTAIKVYNPFTMIWDDCTNQFAPTDITHEDAAGVTVAYKRYTCTLGYGMGERELKICWSET